jgi:aryl-alcohol dehydrogenase-like predicted oxidoreductase
MKPREEAMEHVESRQYRPAVLPRLPGDDELRQTREPPWALDETDAEPILRRAVEGGITFFDTADGYNGGQSEIVTGRLLKRLFGVREAA